MTLEHISHLTSDLCFLESLDLFLEVFSDFCQGADNFAVYGRIAGWLSLAERSSETVLLFCILPERRII